MESARFCQMLVHFGSKRNKQRHGWGTNSRRALWTQSAGFCGEYPCSHSVIIGSA
jgi:hypothetical protein